MSEVASLCHPVRSCYIAWLCVRALACILYELYIGEPPFFADGLYKLIDMVVHNPVRWPNEFPPLLRDFLERLLIKDPRTRLTWPELLDHEYISDLVQGVLRNRLCK